jgi:hypothetical protein
MSTDRLTLAWPAERRAGRPRADQRADRPGVFVSEATVKTHLLRAYAKLGVSGRTAAVTRAMELGVLPSPGQP